MPLLGSADEARVAVASNFLASLYEIETAFERATEHEVVVIAGSTGHLYAQIVNGAPFDVLLAADSERPLLLEDSEHGVADSRFSYAFGRLALWSSDPDLIDAETLLHIGDVEFRRFAIAEPAVAPYGAAAVQVLTALDLVDTVSPRLVKGQSVSQAFAFVATGNAEIGLLALSQALAYTGAASYVPVPADLHDPIRQDAILLARAAGNTAALEFLDFLRGPAAIEIIQRNGYGVAP